MLKYFSFSTFLLLISPALWAQDFTLTYEARNKWLAQENKAPLLELREKLISSGQKKISVVFPKEDALLQEERLLIVSEILGRKVSDLMIVQASGTVLPNQMHFNVTH